MGKSDFRPQFTINVNIAKALMRIEAAKEQVGALPLNRIFFASLREAARLRTTHYSTMIEGNSLNHQQVKEVLLRS